MESDSSTPTASGESRGSDSPASPPGTSDTDTPADANILVRLFRYSDSPVFLWARDIGLALALVSILTISLVLVTGVWPPMAAVSSGSMSPHIGVGDAVVVTEPHRFAPGVADENGIVTYRAGADAGYSTLGTYGSVVLFDSPEGPSEAVVHRAMFRVDKGENWYSRANEEYLNGAESCSELRNCPAPHAGYITKGDANSNYDQAIGMHPPVRPGWVKGVVRVKIPHIGWVRVLAS